MEPRLTCARGHTVLWLMAGTPPSTSRPKATSGSLPPRQVARKRLHVGIVEVDHGLRHGRDAGPDALTHLVVAQRLQQHVLALAREPRRGAEAVEVIAMA